MVSITIAILPLPCYCNPSFWRKEGQFSPADRNTSSDGIKRDLIEKTVQELGSAGSQLTLK